MKAQSKSQAAALLHIEQIRQWCQDRLEATDGSCGNQSLDHLEEGFDGWSKDMATVIQEYGLEESILTDFKTKMIEEIYQKAGSLRSHSWQAHFAKKHGI